jgi:Flp pilus assembly protein TadD
LADWRRVISGKDLLCGFVLVGVAILVYLPCLRGGFVWDDGSMVVANPLVQSPDGLKAAWTGSEGRDYLPVTFSMLWLEWRLWKGSPMGFHIVNVLLHALNSFLLWRLLEKLKVPGAWLGALLFAVHPVNVASVAWIAERKNTLAMAFSLGAVLAYLRSERTGKFRDYATSLILFALALLGKAAAVVVAPGILLFAWWRTEALTRRDFVKAAPYFVFALASGLVTIWFQHYRAIAGEPVPMGGILERLATAGQAWWFYLGKLIFPQGLSMLYPSWDVARTMPWGLAPALLVAVVLFAAWFLRSYGGRPIFFGLAWFTLGLLPTLGFVRMYYFRFSPVADHWQYFAAPGVLALAGAGLFSLIAWNKSVGRIICVAIVALLSILTWNRAGAFHTPERFWKEVQRSISSSWVASSNLAIIHLRQGQPEAALSEAREAVRLAPSAVEARLNLAVILDETGKNRDAITEFSEAVRLRPDLPQTHRGLGVALERSGAAREAVAAYAEVVRLEPQDVKTRFKLGTLQNAMGNHREAIGQFAKVIQAAPDDAEARNSLAIALFLTGQRVEAIREFEEVIRRHPEHQGAKANLQRALQTPQ